MTKLIIQIPCYNEELSINQTLSDLPKNIEGIDEIEVIVIDDGSTDKSAEIASKNGARVLQIKHNKGLANAFRVGLQECLNSGADIIVNTDADNQYNGADIEKLVKPILRGEADIVVGARDIANIKTFSFVKKLLQKFGSAVLRLLSSTDVQDAPSGFRAISRDAALKLNIFDNYTYTMEMLVQAGAKGMRVVSVPIRVNPTERKSKLVKNIFCYVCKSMKTMIFYNNFMRAWNSWLISCFKIFILLYAWFRKRTCTVFNFFCSIFNFSGTDCNSSDSRRFNINKQKIA